MIINRKDNPEEIKKYEHIRRGPMDFPHCFAKCPNSIIVTCSRNIGHSGPHVAHGGWFTPHVYTVWDEDPEPNYQESSKVSPGLKPNDAEAHYNLGKAYAKSGDYQKSIESYKEAIRIKPDYTDAHCGLVISYHLSGNGSSAKEEYKILEGLDKKMADELLNLLRAK